MVERNLATPEATEGSLEGKGNCCFKLCLHNIHLFSLGYRSSKNHRIQYGVGVHVYIHVVHVKVGRVPKRVHPE